MQVESLNVVSSVPHPAQMEVPLSSTGAGGTPIQPRGTPIQSDCKRGIPSSPMGGIPSSLTGAYPETGVPPPILRWGYPPHWAVWGTPCTQMGVPLSEIGWMYLPMWTDRQTHVKTLPSPFLSYAGGNKLRYSTKLLHFQYY